ncbi:MAG: type II secretion system F family protein [Candidatus Aenigmatarchaeota archaeon]
MDKYKRLSTRFFGSLAENLEEDAESLKQGLQKSDLGILYRTYASMMLMTSLLVFLALFCVSVPVSLFLLGKTPAYSLVMGFGASTLSASLAFIFVYYYPIQKSKSRAKSIKNNLPFAINHMAAIASSKVPPYVIFKLLAEFEEYGQVSREAQKIVRDVDVFGHDITTALKQAAGRTPSKEFQEFLSGLISVEETGGNLVEFLEVQADEAMFDYKQKRKRYLDSLSTYADFYTAVLIAAPLFLVAVLTIMSMVGGEVLGMNIEDAMTLGIYGAIPLMNTAFIAFIHFTQPEVV